MWSVGQLDSARFATLSGDFNPLHLDPVAARRLPFGETVAHGMHVVLSALDRVVGDGGPCRLAALKVRFARPVRHGQPVRLVSQRRLDDRWLFAVQAQDEAVRMEVRLEEGPPLGPRPSSRRFAPASCPRPRDLQALPRRGVAPLALELAEAVALWPTLARRMDPSDVALLLAASRLAGMEVGEGAVLAGLSLRRAEPHLVPDVRWRLQPVNPRLGVLAIHLEGPGLQGRLDVLFRPPVPQPSLAEVSRVIAPQAFRGQRALVVGGGRGLGEVLAKVVAAGGGEVVLTWHQGREDAERVCAEIRAAGGRARVCRFDAADEASLLPAELAPSHVYYCAFPPDGDGTGAWDVKRFRRLARVGAVGLERLLGQLARTDGSRVEVIYPSTRLLDGGHGQPELLAAKAAGEAAGRVVSARLPGVRFRIWRLPPLRTDRTNGVLPIGARPVLHEVAGLLQATVPVGEDVA